jgi:hypothetical protein NreA
MHKTHPEIIPRLKRAEGHLRSVVAMIEAGRPCLDIAQQLQAIEAAVAKAKKALIHDHIEHCFDASAPETASLLEEMRKLAKYL